MFSADTTDYENIVEELVENHPTAVQHDPFQVASSVIAGIDRSVSPADGYVRTHGTSEFLDVTLYPSDVVAISGQPQIRVDRRWAQNGNDGTIHDESIEVYAIYTMLLDLEDALQQAKN